MCKFDIQIHTSCDDKGREFNALDTMFIRDDPYYKMLCDIVGLPIIVPSELMKELESIRGSMVHFIYNGEDYHAILDFDENYNIMFKEIERH